MIVPDPYTITETLHKDATVTLYRGVRRQDGAPVVIKTFYAEAPAPREIERLRHEYEIARRLDSPYLLKPYEVDQQKAQVRLILEDFDGEPLSGQLGRPLETSRFLDIARQLAAALADIHRQDIVHKDLKPANTLIHPQTGAIKLTGFGIAARLVHTPTALTGVSLIEGSLAYMSPEQTGRMNRGIDHRSDLYSLGVIFYQMLTGELPFQAADPLEWAHCHIARPPRPPTEIVPTIPEPLAALVLKLLAKQAEERYQSAHGLQLDLEHCREQWVASGEIAPFPLGKEDASDRFLISPRLYGREKEMAALLGSFEQVAATGQAWFVLVSGYAGIGKSALVRELHRLVVQARGYFIAGKFDQYQRDIPYATLAQAFHDLLQQILTESDERIQSWKVDLEKALGANGRLIVDLIPQLELIIGPQPPVPELSPTEAQHRFHLVFHRFVGVFAQKEHPLVLFLDDLQWLDPASLKLMAYLITHPDPGALFLIGAYRDNEVSPSHPLMRTLAEVRRSDVSLQELVLGPLSPTHLQQWVADTLRRPLKVAAPLARLVYDKTAGNPFFAIQFLTTLYQEGLLAYDQQHRHWRWDLPVIRQQDFTDNVVELMLGKLKRFSAPTQQALMLAACLGNTAEVGTLALLCDRPEEQLYPTLREAIDEGLVWRVNGSYKFLHDRVQEAAYALLPEVERPAQHLQIGRLLLSHTPEDRLAENIFEIVGHLNRGAALITAPAERERLAELNVAAGKRARASIAYATARDFFADAAALLPEETWDTRYDFQFALFLDWAEAEYLHGAFEEAERLFAILLAQAKSDLDRAKVYDLRLTVYPIAGKYDDAVAMAIKALQLLGVDIPEDDQALNLAIEAEVAEVKEKLKGRKIPELAAAPEATDPRVKAVIGILIRMGGPAYIGSRPQLYPLTPLKALNYFLKYGVTKETGSAFSGYAFMLASVFGDPHAGYAFSELAIKLGQRFNDLNTIGTALYIHGNHVNFWLKPIATDFPVLERGFRVCLDGGNLVHANYIAYSIVWQAVERGDTLDDVLDFSHEYASFALGSRNEAIYQTIVLEQQFLKCLMGETDGNVSFSDEGVSELSCVEKIAKVSFTCGITYYHTMKMMAAYLMGDSSASRTHAEEAKIILAAVMAQPMEATFYFLYALVLTRACREAAEDERGEILKTLYTYREKLAFWAENCPANFASKHALVSAEIAEIEGNELSAERLFEQAIESARENGFIHWEAMVNEAAARFHGSRGLKTVSRAYLREARYCYARWGADGKVQQLDQQYPHLAETRSLIPTATFAAPAEQLDLLAVIKASQAISSEILLSTLQETLMRLVLEHAAAQRGSLLLVEAESLTIHARAELAGEETQVEVTSALPVSAATLPLSLLNYVRRTGEAVVLADAAAEGRYVDDEYITRHQPRSVIGLPIVRQAQVVGLLYLENNLTADAFTPDRLTALELLAAQAAVSLDNARVYEALRNSEEKYRRLVDTASEGIWILGPDLMTTFVNARMAEMTGYAAEELIGRPFTEVMFEEDWPDHDQQMENRKQGISKNYERRIRRKDGQTVWTHVSATPIFDDKHQFNGTFGMFTDITERKRAEDALKLNEGRYRLSQAVGHVGSWQYDIQTTRFWGSDEAKRLYGFDPEQDDFSTDEVEKCIPERERVHQALVDLIEADIPYNLEFEIRPRNSAEPRIISSIAELQKDDHGRPLRVVGVIQDITERKRAEEEIRRLNQELEQRVLERTAQLEAANKELEAFAYSVSHDLRAPLRAISGFTAILARRHRANLNDEGQHYLDNVAQAGERMAQLINDLLAYSRLGRAGARRQPVALDDIFTPLAEEFTGRVKEIGGTLEIADDLPMVMGDRTLLTQIFTNLLDNALTYRRVDVPARVSVTPQTEAKTVIICVRDNGIGIPAEYQEKIFNIFQRLHSEEDYPGTGIGLATVKKSVEMLGGRLWVESEVGQGSAFFIKLAKE